MRLGEKEWLVLVKLVRVMKSKNMNDMKILNYCVVKTNVNRGYIKWFSKKIK